MIVVLDFDEVGSFNSLNNLSDCGLWCVMLVFGFVGWWICTMKLCALMETGLGNLAELSDALILDILSLLGAKTLGILAAVSKSFYVFSYHEENWRSRVLEVSASKYAGYNGNDIALDKIFR